MIIEQHIGVCGSLMNARLAWVPPSPTSHETYTSVTPAQSPMLSSSFIDREQRVHQILKPFEKKENYNYRKNFKAHQNYCSCCNYLLVSGTIGESETMQWYKCWLRITFVNIYCYSKMSRQGLKMGQYLTIPLLVFCWRRSHLSSLWRRECVSWEVASH